MVSAGKSAESLIYLIELQPAQYDDEQPVTTFESLVTISFDLSELGITATDLPVGFRLEADNTYSFFFGTLEDGIFSFQIDSYGTFGIMLNVELDVLRFSVGNAEFTQNGNDVSIDVEPFIENDRVSCDFIKNSLILQA